MSKSLAPLAVKARIHPSVENRESATFVVTQEARTPSEATGTEQSRGEEERGGRLLEPGGGASSPAGAGQTDRPA
ncbi:hypothetical protein KUCAC02_001929 [Chaenocephalus aceratus]|uniref:Uncharacterized protein n=1 Tax=Chaenocephalus aceratus TaxID=36190 RepID=A0ACB9XSZ7_CHAAC|nr:hypothetical protein KUCAC02_001929 [Chaenocephalus aceratus]